MRKLLNFFSFIVETEWIERTELFAEASRKSLFLARPSVHVVSNILLGNSDQFFVNVQANNSKWMEKFTDGNCYMTYITTNIQNPFVRKPFWFKMFDSGILLLSRISVTVVTVVISVNKPVHLYFRLFRILFFLASSCCPGFL